MTNNQIAILNSMIESYNKLNSLIFQYEFINSSPYKITDVIMSSDVSTPAPLVSQVQENNCSTRGRGRPRKAKGALNH